jgi:NADPH-dependent curcumin reductase CurA
VVGTFGVQEYVVSDGRGTMKIDTSLAPPSTCLGALGMPGMTAYFGLLDVGALRDGETVYNNATPVKGSSDYLSLLVRRARMEGIVVFDCARRYPQTAQDIPTRIGAGRIKVKEHVVSGSTDDFPEALQMLFRGENVGNLELA